jgi:catechol 2,3-dioxygenase-like lactoylglutathione lyase family enzyme
VSGIGLKRLQHLVLWVSDVDRSVRFYCDVLGFEVKTRYPKATISRSEKLFEKGILNYELALKGAKVAEVTLTPEGKWVSPK